MSRRGLPVKGSLKILMGLLALLFLQSCGNTPATSPVTVTIGSPANKLKSVSISKSLAAGAYEFVFTISGPDMTDIISEVPAAQNDITVTFQVPNGDSRHFVVEYLDPTGTPLYRGDAYADLNGREVSLEIIMRSIGNLMGGATQGITLNLSGDVSTIDGSAGIQGTANGVGSSARFNYPNGITTDGTHLYVADTGNNSVRKIDIPTNDVETIPVTGLNNPHYITTDGVNLYVLDTGNNSVRKVVIETGAASIVATGFNGPAGITTDGANVYVTEAAGNAVSKADILTGDVSVIAGSGSPGSADGIGEQASFNSPAGVTTDGSGLFLADANNNTVRYIK